MANFAKIVLVVYSALVLTLFCSCAHIVKRHAEKRQMKELVESVLNTPDLVNH